MAVAFQVEVAEAVLSELKRGSWSQTFQPERLYYAVFTAEDLRDLRVSVIPLTYTDEKLSRSSSQYSEGVIIDVQKQVQPQDKRQVDDLIAFMDELFQFFGDGHRLATQPARWCEAVRLVDDRLWSPEILYTQSAFEAALEVTVSGAR
jgi:hypothetical protein